MDAKELTAGLSAVADELVPPCIDVDDVISAAKLATRRRRAVAAAAASPVLVAVLLLVIGTSTGFGHHGRLDAVRAAGTSSSGPDASYLVPANDKESKKLTQQLIDARATVIPSKVTVSSTGADPALEFRYWAPGDRGPVAVPYVAEAVLMNGTTTSTLTIAVSRRDRNTVLDCQPALAEMDCATRSLLDGTKILTFDDTVGAQRVVTGLGVHALRPDGTYIEVAVQVPSMDIGNPPVLSAGELQNFVPVFSY